MCDTLMRPAWWITLSFVPRLHKFWINQETKNKDKADENIQLYWNVISLVYYMRIH